jgi:hypothetical protein
VFERRCFLGECLCAAGERAECERAGGPLGVGAGTRAQGRTGGEERCPRATLELLAELVRGEQNERPQLVHGSGARPDRTLAAGEQRAQRLGRLAQPGSGSGAASEDGQRRPLGIERVRLQPRAQALFPALRPLHLEHPLPVRIQEAGQPRPVTARALERPSTTSPRAPTSEPQRLPVAAPAGADLERKTAASTVRLDKDERMGRGVRVHANHEVKLVCEHASTSTSLGVTWCRP